MRHTTTSRLLGFAGATTGIVLALRGKVTGVNAAFRATARVDRALRPIGCFIDLRMARFLRIFKRSSNTHEPQAKRSRGKRVLRVIAAVVLLPIIALLVGVALTPFPSELTESQRLGPSVRVLDRNGKLLSEVRAKDGMRARWMPYEEVGQTFLSALICAEDSRFFWHPGFDPIAIARAASQNLFRRTIVSGASTLTQQLARTLVPRKRTYYGKVLEITVAMRIEASLSKHEILEAYVNLVEFGPMLRGVESASMFYFDKPTKALSLAEAATLAAMPKGPTVFDPRRSPTRLKQRRDYILDRMLAAGSVTEQQVGRAKREPITVFAQPTGWSAPHLIRAILQGQVHPQLPVRGIEVSEIQTTLDATLQREAQTAARAIIETLRDRHATAAAVVVLHNPTGHVLSWVGAHDFRDKAALGQNDGVIALRQPGSTLKPFVYATAMRDLQYTAATALPDIDLFLPGQKGTYRPQNYDGRYHGPVRLREALANSYNIPAVYAASVVGPSRVLRTLRDAGFDSLDQSASHYGAAIALGDGEVKLIEIAQAYAMLARGGNLIEYRSVIGAKDKRGNPIAIPAPATRDVIAPDIARVLTDILADRHARQAAFGTNSVLELPFPTAAKTGTSKTFRDNVAVGYTPHVTVAAWVGNFDGSPMNGISGVSGAGPLFRTVMLAAHRRFHGETEDFPAADEGFERARVCTLSGELPTPACESVKDELFIRGTAPQRPCTMHRLIEVDTRNGLIAGPRCSQDQREERRFETFSSRYQPWAQAAHRPIAPTEFSPNCPGDSQDLPHDALASQRLSIRYPYSGAVFLDDPSMPHGVQGIVVRIAGPSGVQKVVLSDNERVIATLSPPFEYSMKLSQGTHRLRATGGGLTSDIVEFEVRR